jgi:hypothetical protein
MMWAAALVLVGCASANVGVPNNDVDGPGPTPDGPGNDPDSPPQPVTATLRQTTNETVAPNNSVACAQIDGGSGALLFTHANSWYRVYSLSEAGISGTFNVSSVTFAVESAQNEPPVTVKVGTYSGTPDDNAPLTLGQASFLATTTAAVANTAVATTVTAQINAAIPAGSNLIIEITSTARTTNGDRFLLGTTNGPFQHTNYLSASVCNINTPTVMASVCTGCGDSQAIINVTGTH